MALDYLVVWRKLHLKAAYNDVKTLEWLCVILQVNKAQTCHFPPNRPWPHSNDVRYSREKLSLITAQIMVEVCLYKIYQSDCQKCGW